MKRMTIGRLARQSGVSIDTVRFYERVKLIEEPTRTPSNYRLYPEKNVDRLRFIKKCRNLGFSLSDIRELLALRCDPLASKSSVKQKVEVKIRDIRQKIKGLNRILTVLKQLSHECDGRGPISDCPILKALERKDSKEPQQNHQ